MEAQHCGHENDPKGKTVKQFAEASSDEDVEETDDNGNLASAVDLSLASIHDLLNSSEDVSAHNVSMNSEFEHPCSSSSASEALSDVNLHQWYMNKVGKDCDIKVDKEKEEENLKLVLHNVHLSGGLRWDQVALFFYVKELNLPFQAEQVDAEQYLEKFSFVGHVLDQVNNKRYYLNTQANFDDVRLELDDQQSEQSYCCSSWGAQTTADYDDLLEDAWVDEKHDAHKCQGPLHYHNEYDSEVDCEPDSEVDCEPDSAANVDEVVVEPEQGHVDIEMGDGVLLLADDYESDVDPVGLLVDELDVMDV